MGINDLNKKYELKEIVKGDSIFCATGITDSIILNGIKFNNNEIISETLVTHKSLNFKKIIKKVNPFNEWYLFQEKNGLKKKLVKIQ